jgi:hypothetical protein
MAKKRVTIGQRLERAASDIANAVSVAATGSEIGVLELAVEDELSPRPARRARKAKPAAKRKPASTRRKVAARKKKVPARTASKPAGKNRRSTRPSR